MRYGLSLGVDLTPLRTCSLNCVFCQIGATSHRSLERKEYVPTTEVLSELKEWVDSGATADVISLAGSGEPTLHSRFGEILDYIARETPFTAVLLSNGTLFHDAEVRRQAACADIVKLSLGAWDQESFERLNRPHPDLRFDDLIDGYLRFRAQFRGEIRLEVFLLPNVNSLEEQVSRIAQIAATISPDRVELNTAVRPTAEVRVAAVPRAELAKLATLFSPHAEVPVNASAGRLVGTAGDGDGILGTIRRHPCTVEQLAELFDLNRTEANEILQKLVQRGDVSADQRPDGTFYFVN